MNIDELESLVRRIPELQPSPDLEERIRMLGTRPRRFRAMLPLAASLIFCLAGLWFALSPSVTVGGRGKPQYSSLSIRFVHDGNDYLDQCRDEGHWKTLVAELPVASPEDLEMLLQTKGRERVAFTGDAATPWSLVKRARSACQKAGIATCQWRIFGIGTKDRVLDVPIPPPPARKPPEKVILEPIQVKLRWNTDHKALLQSIGSRSPAASDEALMDTIQAMSADYRKAGKTEWPVYLEAAGDVPWKGIVHVMDLCRARQLDPVKFEDPNPLLETIPRPRDIKRLPPPKDD